MAADAHDRAGVEAGAALEAVDRVAGAGGRASHFGPDVIRAMEQVIVGQRYMLDRLLIGLLADGHVLLEGVPGLAKTLAVNTLAQALHARYQRIQFTPDLLPADLIGTLIYKPQSGEFRVRKGPVFANLCSPTRSTARRPRCRARCSRRCRSTRSRSATRPSRCRSRSWCSRPRTRSSRRAPIRCPRRRSTASCSSSRSATRTATEELEILERMARTTPPPPIRAVADTDQVLQARASRRRRSTSTTRSRTTSSTSSSRPASPTSYGLDARPLHRLRRLAARLDLPGAGGQGARVPRRAAATSRPQDVKSIGMDVLRHRVLTTYEAEAEGVDAARI